MVLLTKKLLKSKTNQKNKLEIIDIQIILDLFLDLLILVQENLVLKPLTFIPVTIGIFTTSLFVSQTPLQTRKLLFLEEVQIELVKE